MGLTYLDIEVGHPDRTEDMEQIKFLIDSGAMYSVVPRPVLERFGIRSHTQREFRIANGMRITREVGVALFRYEDRIGGADVIFGENGDSNLLGAMTLEALGLALDPIGRRLIELPMLL